MTIFVTVRDFFASNRKAGLCFIVILLFSLKIFYYLKFKQHQLTLFYGMAQTDKNITGWNLSRIFSFKEHFNFTTDAADHSAMFETSQACRFADARLIVYNRVPKTGSETVLSTLRKFASTRSKLVYKHSNIYHQPNLTNEEVNKFKYDLNSLSEKKLVIFDRHIYFVDLHLEGHVTPAYINTFRDPVNRSVSLFYYTRLKGTQRNKYSMKEKNVTFEECFHLKEKVCKSVDYESIVTSAHINFFCGTDRICSNPGPVSLAKAKQNIEKHYVLIGPSDDLSGFFKALEKLIPEILRGVLNIYQTYYSKGANHVHTDVRYIFPSPAVIEELKVGYFQYEYELYKFLNKRYYTLKNMFDEKHC